MKPVKLVILCSVLAVAGCGDKDDAGTQTEEAVPLDQPQGMTNGTMDSAPPPVAPPAEPMDSAPADQGDALAPDAAGEGMTEENSGDAVPTPMEPESDAGTTAPDQATADTMTDPAADAAAPASGAAGAEGTDLAMGQTVYQGKCQACHATGAAGAPKLDDRANWEPRIAQGMDTLNKHAIEGFKGAVGYMPPKGGFASLSDEEVRAAVAYMVSQIP